MRVMTFQQMAQIFDVFPFPETNQKGTGFCVDSRLAKAGDIFFALAGEKVDGHAYLQEAIRKGAIAAVVQENYQGSNFGIPLFRVKNPLQALQNLAKKSIENKTHIVAVTGSIGKTTTKEFIKTILEQKYAVAASIGNSNSQIGLPLTILNHTTGLEDILVLEMGMTEPGQLSTLVNIAPPEVAVLTTAALVHACRFETLQEIALTKAEIFSHPQTKMGILPCHLEAYETIIQMGKCSKISFSAESAKGDYYLENYSQDGIQINVENQTISLGKLNVPGKHNIHNLLAAIVVARYFNLSWDEIRQGISHLKLPEKRLQFVHQRGILFLNDSYNASELSVKAALETLSETNQKGEKIAVLGSMMELGHFSDESHRKVGVFALEHVDKMYCLGVECLPIVEVWKKAGKPVEFFTSRQELVLSLSKKLKPSDIVLLKGSRSKELWKVLEELV